MPVRKLDVTKISESSLTMAQTELANQMASEIKGIVDEIPSRASKRIISTSPNFVLPRSYFDFDGINSRLYIRNVVATFNVGFMPNLESMAFCGQCVIPGKFNPTGFAAMRLTVFSPGSFRPVALLFSNGKAVFTGSRSEWHARSESWKFARLLCYMGYPANLIDFRIQNIVCSYQFGHPVDCYEIVDRLGSVRVTYDPDEIQACFVRNSEPDIENITTLMFSKGGGVITGIRERSQIEKVYREVYELGEAVSHDFGGYGQSGYRHRKKRELSAPTKLESINRDIQLLADQKLLEGMSGRKRTRAEEEQVEERQLLIEQTERKRQKLSLRKLKRQARLKRTPAQPFASANQMDMEIELPNQIPFTISPPPHSSSFTTPLLQN